MSVMRAVPPSSLDGLVSLDEANLRTRAALSGEFDDRLKELRQAKIEAEAAVGIANTVEAAASLKVEADEYAARVRGEVDRLKVEAFTLDTDTRARASGLSKRESKLQDSETNHASARAAFEKEAASVRADLESRALALKNAESVLDASAQALKKEKTEVSAMRTMLNTRLDALKVAEG